MSYDRFIDCDGQPRTALLTMLDADTGLDELCSLARRQRVNKRRARR